MTLVSISDAAKLVRRDRKTLYRDIKKGKLSATVGDSGMSQVETSELIRVYGALNTIGDKNATNATETMPQHETPHATHSDSADSALIAALQAENKQLHERIKEKDNHIEDMRNTMRLLEYHAKKPWWKIW